MTDSDKEPTMYDHTPEPWYNSEYSGGDTGIYAETEHGHDICLIRDTKDAKANMRLFMAAPRLLRERDELRDLLKSAAHMLSHYRLPRGGELGGPWCDESLKKIQAAIDNTAKGGQ